MRYLAFLVKGDGIIWAEGVTGLAARAKLLYDERGGSLDLDLALLDHGQHLCRSCRCLSHGIGNVLWPLATTDNVDAISGSAYWLQLGVLL